MDSEGWGGMLSLYWEFYWRDAWKVVIFQFVSTACLFSPPLSLSLFLLTSLMSAPSTHPWLSFWLHRSSFRDRWKREEEKGLQRERVTVNVGPEQIAQAAKHSLLGSTLTSIWGSLRVFCSSMWQLGCQIKLGKASGRANLLTAISRHTNTHKNAFFAFLQLPYGADTDSVAAWGASLFLKWTQKQTQCYGNDHITEQCRVPDPEVQEAVNQCVTAAVWPVTLPTPGLSLLSVRSLSFIDL